MIQDKHFTKTTSPCIFHIHVPSHDVHSQIHKDKISLPSAVLCQLNGQMTFSKHSRPILDSKVNNRAQLIGGVF